MNALREAPTQWRRLDVAVRDLPLAIALFVATLVFGITVLPLVDGGGTVVGLVPARPFDAMTIVVAALECLPLALRRRYPAICIATVSLGFALDQLRGYHTIAGVALMLALFSTAAHLERRRRTVAIALTAAYAVFAVGLDRLAPGAGLDEYLTFYLALAAAWFVGVWLRRTRATALAQRTLAAETARAAERHLLARELHDVVTHHVTAMVVQAEAARYLSDTPERLAATLDVVSQTGRSAVAELRQLLGLLDPAQTESRRPAGHDIGALVERIRQAGQPVEFTQTGEAADDGGDSEGAELTAYRVAQEALTNALKHAAGRRTVLRVDRTRHAIVVEASTEGSDGAAVIPGAGRGLAGLAERVTSLGGEFSAGPRPEGGFAVSARIPAGGPA